MDERKFNHRVRLGPQSEVEWLCVRNLLDCLQERVFFKDEQSRFLLVSKGWLAAEGHGRSLDDVIGKTDFDIFSYGFAREAFEDERRVMATGEPITGKVEHETFDNGPDAWVSVAKMPLRDETGTIVGTFGLCRDVTAQIEAEQERERAIAELSVARDQAVEASNMKSAFLANMSHEIRTPMNGVIGMTELLLGMELGEEQREAAEQIARSGEQMLSIINDILDISKIETGHLELDITDFDLHEGLRNTCAIASAQAKAKGLLLDLQISHGVPARVRGDGRRIHQIVLNLVSNAIKFTSEGSVTVRLLPNGPASEDGTPIRIEVNDSGIGIDPAKLDRMFEPFTQADVSTTRLYGGTGLGLAIARELVELMDGTISADSQPGQGSTFHFELLLAKPLIEQAPATGRDIAIAATWAKPPEILVAEDSQINQIVAARSLERCGCRVDVVANGADALKAIKTKHYDAVLMDCQMPGMDGYQATRQLRARETSENHVPVIAMTAQAMEGDRERCLAAGMDDFVTKPMRHNELIEVLHRWIPTHTDEEEVRGPATGSLDEVRARPR